MPAARICLQLIADFVVYLGLLILASSRVSTSLALEIKTGAPFRFLLNCDA
jgi:hypothetical protein